MIALAFSSFLILLLPTVSGQQTLCATWNILNSTNTGGGIPQSSVSTLDACKAACLTSTTGCIYGFDWVPTAVPGSLCYISTTAVLNLANGVYHFTCPDLKATPASTTAFGAASTTVAGGSNATAAPPSGCRWVESQNSFTVNGQQQSNANTLVDCQTACLTINACQLGLDWNPANPAGSKCFLSRSSTLNSITGISHFGLACDIATQNTQFASTTGPYNPACIPVFTNNTNTPGGIQQPYTTLDQCTSQCLAAQSTTCKFGFDWNPSAAAGSQCWFSTSSASNNFPGIYHVNFTCSGGCTWVITNNTNSPGGSLQTSLATVDQCTAQCLASKDTTCKYGFDWNGSQCWFSTTTITSQASGVNHYVYQCSSPSLTTVSPLGGCSWAYMNNTNSPGGILQPYTTLDQCTSQCLAAQNTTCKYGFDWNSNTLSGYQCWFATSTATSNYTGVYHFTYQCTSATGGCSYTYANNTNSPGGIKQPYTTLDQCKSQCQTAQSTTCKYGFDWNPLAPVGSQCWFATTTATSNFPGCFHFTYQCTSGGVTQVPGGCSYTYANNTNSPGGIQQPYTTLDQCTSQCQTAQSTTCKYGFDWNPLAPVGSQCWFATTTATSNFPGCFHFTYQCTSGGATSVPGGCSYTYANNTNSPGGIQQPYTTLDQCTSQCQTAQNTTCKYGFDWNPLAPVGSQCWFATTTATSNFPGCFHFTYQCTSGLLVIYFYLAEILVILYLLS